MGCIRLVQPFARETFHLSPLSPSVSLANITMPRHRQGQFVLDRTFAFIEGHPSFFAVT
jgi:hypothetical protein